MKAPFHLTLYGLFLTVLVVPSAFAQQSWIRLYGGAAYDNGYSVQQTRDTGYVVAGLTTSFGDDYQVYLVKTDASGDTLWTRTYGGAGVEMARSVRQTPEGGYILAGYSTSFGDSDQIFLVRTDASGDTLWTRTYGGMRNEVGESAQPTQDGGFIVSGSTSSYGSGGYDLYLIKTDASGDTLWTRTFGGANDDYGEGVREDRDGGYVVTGRTNSMGNGFQAWLVKTDASGHTLWMRTYGGVASDYGYSVQQTRDGGYIIGGYTNSYGMNGDAYLVKTDTAGILVWQRNYGGSDVEYAGSVGQTTDGGYILTGYTTSFGNSYQLYLIRTDSLGDTLWTRTYGGPSSDDGKSVQQTLDGGFIVGGYTYSYGSGSQVYLIKADPNGNVGVEEKPQASEPKPVNGLKVWPNPFASFATLPGYESERFVLYDISGRKVGTFKGNRIGEGLPSGVYFLTPEEGNAKPLRIVKIR